MGDVIDTIRGRGPDAFTDFGAVLTPAEVAGAVGVSDHTIRNLCASGELPAFKVGRRWCIRRDELLAGWGY